MTINAREKARAEAIDRPRKFADIPTNKLSGKKLAVSEYFGENVFSIEKTSLISEMVKRELVQMIEEGKPLSQELASIYANAVTQWAMSKGATHFCHWFQPLTGTTAEKHDAFLNIGKNGQPIEKLGVSQLMQGEPDASSFPHGGARSTFEARGYTAWDVTSPIFLIENTNGKTLCIPTAFVSYHGDALDIKTPLLRSLNKVNHLTTEFLKTAGLTDVENVIVTCGAEQEYFLVDKAFYFQRRDLVMTGRTLIGSLTSRNQQLEDHYFGEIPERVVDFMQEVEIELYKVGVPAKTRHNEVAPGQFELACIFSEGNIASDHNHLVMTTLKKVAKKHDFVVLLHEKPFQGINGSGKHLNWSLATNTGINLFEPGQTPHENKIFLACVSMALETIRRHPEIIRASIASHGNDHRLGANEAPPSILSVFLGTTLTNIFKDLSEGRNTSGSAVAELDMGARQLVKLLKDNTDRNRTSPFAFTGNKFEFRAVGSTAAVGFPLAVLNAAFCDVVLDATQMLKDELAKGSSADEALLKLAKTFFVQSENVIFNGDGYSEDWLKEAERRGLPNLKNTVAALAAFKDKNKIAFFERTGIFRSGELLTRYNVLLERYIKHREIEYKTLHLMVEQHVMPVLFSYQKELLQLLTLQKQNSHNSVLTDSILSRLESMAIRLQDSVDKLAQSYAKRSSQFEEEADFIANTLFPQMEALSELCNEIEDIIPDNLWPLPKSYDLLFAR